MRWTRFVARRQKRAFAAGFTLVELLTVVAITGVLATLGTMLVRQRFKDAKSIEATSLIQAIRGAQESKRAETGSYQNCSVSAGTPWYPGNPDGTYRAWRYDTHPDWDTWKELGVSRPEGTQFGFLVNAGIPSTKLPVPQTAEKPTWPTAVSTPPLVDPWYVIQAAGDRDKDTTLSLFLATSLNGELYVENDGE